jgi:hypothetical protein
LPAVAAINFYKRFVITLAELTAATPMDTSATMLKLTLIKALEICTMYQRGSLKKR